VVTDAVRALVRVSAAIGRGDREAVAGALEDAVRVAPPDEIEEVLLQSHLFAGYPAMLQAIGAWRVIRPDAAVDEAEDPASWPARGERVCSTIYAGQYERLRANVQRMHPALDRWMISDGYGRVLGRPGLSLVVRELCIVALLCAQDVPEQLYAHLRGALNAGATEDAVEEAVSLACAPLSEERRAGARARWEIVRARRTG
jgi:4-carboxymuconolactone decarboxylase